MAFSFNNGGKIALAYDVRIWFRNLEDPAVFMAVHLSGKVKEVDVRINIGGIGEGRLTKWATEMNTTSGMVCRHDLLDFQNFGFALGFAEVKFGDVRRLAAMVHVCEASEGKLRSQTQRFTFVPADEIKRAVPYFVGADGLIVTYVCPV